MYNTKRKRFGVRGFVFGDAVVGDGLARESIPKEEFLAALGGAEGHAAGDDFADSDGILCHEYLYYTRFVV